MGEQQDAPAPRAERETVPAEPLPGRPSRRGRRQRHALDEASYRMLVEHGRDVIILHGTDGVIRYVTPSVHATLGYTPAELRGRRCLDFIHPADRPTVEDHLAGPLAEGEVQPAVRYRARRKDGSWAWLDTLAVPVREDPQAPTRVTGVMTTSRDVTAALEAAQALATSEQRLRLAIRTAGLGVYDIEFPSREGFYSDEYLKIFGYTDEHRRWFNAGWEPTVHPLDAPAQIFMRERLRRGEQEYINTESRRMHADGRWVWVRIFGRAFAHDARGRPTRMISIVQDIDERRRDMAALEESRARLRQAQAMARLGDWRLDLPSMRHRWSDEAFHVLGLMPGECEPSLTAFLSRVHPDDVDRMAEVARQMQADPAELRVDFRIRLASGAVRHVNLHTEPRYDARGQVTGVDGTVQDVTERKAVEDTLRSTAAELAQAQEIARVGSWRWNAVEGTLHWSPLMFRILGLDPAAGPVPYAEQHRLFSADTWQQLLVARHRAMHDGLAYEVELEGRRGDGSQGWFTARGAPLRDDHGRIIGIFGTLQDISDHKRAEAEMRAVRDQLRELSRHTEERLNDERKRIALDVHDELGQMLTAMKLQVDLLQSRLNDPAAAGQAADRLRALIADTIEVTRNVALNLRPPALDLGLLPALEWLAEDFELRAELACRVEAAGGDVRLGERVAIELFRIAQESLTNVARHARDASGVRLALQVSPGMLCLGIHDDGCGFDPEVEPPVGHFGLLGMRERALRLGAELQITSRPGAGTSVRVCLPLDHGQTPREPST